MKRSNKPQEITAIFSEIEGIVHQPVLEVVDKHNYPLKPSLPLLTNEAKAECYRRYKHYELEYNKKVYTANARTRKVNQEVEENTAKAENKESILSIQASFRKNYHHLNTWEKNAKAEEFNQKYPFAIIPRVKIQPLRDNHENFFRLILWEYASQLQKYTKIRRGSGVTYARPLPQVEINTKHLENCKGADGLYLTHITPETMLNRKKRLEEAGVLINSVYRGITRGTLQHINPEIMAVFDGISQNLLSAENQPLTPHQTKKFRDTVLTTGTLSEHLIKGAVENTTPRERTGENPGNNALPPEDFTGTPSSTAKPMPEATEGKPAAEISNGLLATILPIWQLAHRLQGKEYVDYEPICRKTLIWECENGTMSREEYRELLLQEIFKIAGKLYGNRTIFGGEWYNAYHIFCDRIMKTKKGQVFHKNKALEVFAAMKFTLIDPKYGALRASKYSGFQFSPPSCYLDPANELKGSFKYFYKRVMERYAKVEEKRKKLINNQPLINQKRAEDYQNNRKLERKLREREQGKISLEELIRYVQYNMPKHFVQTLPERIARFGNGFKAA